MAEILRYTLLIEFALLAIGFPGSQCSNSGFDEDQHGLYMPSGEDIDALFPVLVRRNDFFLKAAKSVPRIGRRNDFFYAKAHKSVPRIGRRNDFFLKASKSVPRMGRRDGFTSSSDKEAAVAWPWFRDIDYVPSAMKKNIDGNDPDILFGPNQEIPELRQQALV